MELLLIATIVALVKMVQDGRTDRAYAEQGMVSPRHQARIARQKRLEAAGRPTPPVARGPLRTYLSELYADAVNDLAVRHQVKRAAREPYTYDPAAPKWHQRFDARVAQGAARWQRSRGWDMAKAAGRAFIAPVGEPHADRPVVAEVAAPAPVPVRPTLGARYVDDMSGRVMEWDGQAWAPVCSRCGVRMAAHDRDGWLTCGRCGVRATDDWPTPPTDHQEHNDIATTTPGGIMTSISVEAGSYETAHAALGDLAAAKQNLTDEITGAKDDGRSFIAHVEEIDAARDAVAQATLAVQEQLAAQGLSGSSMGQVTAAMEMIQDTSLHEAIDLIERALALIVAAEGAVQEASIAIGQAQADMAEQLGDAHERVASELGGNGAFLNAA
jgi:hypothetical protein